MENFSKKEFLYDTIYTSLVGKEIEIVDSKNKNYIGIIGTIVLEKKYDLILQTNNGEKRVRKDIISFKFTHKGQPLYMDGNLLFNTLQTRIKKVK